MATAIRPGKIESWLLVCGSEAPQLLAPIQDDIDLEGLARFAALLVDQEAPPIWSDIENVEAVGKRRG